MNTHTWKTGFPAPFDGNMRLQIPEGDAGTDCTIAAMIAVCHHAALTNAQELRDAVGTSADAQAVYDFLRDRVTFKADPERVELVRTPAQMLAEIRRDGKTLGDCDDRATLGVSLMLAVADWQLQHEPPNRVRMPTMPVFVVCGMHPAGNFQHVYAGFAFADHFAGRWASESREPPEWIGGIDPQERAPFLDHPPAGRYRVYAVPPAPHRT